MKNILKKICYTMLIGILITSCDDEDNTDVSKISYTHTEITLSSSQSSYTFAENLIDPDASSTNSVTINASIPEAKNIDAIVTFTQTSGNADNLDYTIGQIRIPAGATSGSTTLEIFETEDLEGTETFKLTAVVDNNGNFSLSSPYEVSVTINDDSINDVLEFTTTWSGSFTDADNSLITADFCAIDIDVLLFTSTGAFVQYLGATGACTETGSLSGLPDGDYFLVLDLFANPLSGLGLTETVPVRISYSQEHFNSGTFTYNGYNLGSPTGLTAVADLTISGYNYTVTPR